MNPNTPVNVARTLAMLGTIFERERKYEVALQKYEQALALKVKYGSPQDVEIDERDIARVSGKVTSPR